MQSSTQQVWVIIMLIVAAIAGLIVSVYMHRPPHAVTLPEGSVQIKTFHYPVSFMAQLKGDPHAGVKIFHGYCGHCHGKHPIIPLAAPKIGDKPVWAALSKQVCPNY